MKKVSIADVAKEANVSKSLVSQYLNDRFHYMSVDTKNRIKTAIEELNYKPNYVARSLRQKKTSTIGVIVANILHSFSTQVIRSIEDYFQSQQMHVIVCNAHNDPEKEKNHIEMLMAKQVDGLIVFPTGKNLDIYHRLISESYPLVFMDRLSPTGDGCSILLNNEKASSIAVQNFMDSGIHDIAIVTPSYSRHLTPRLERVRGYRKMMEKSGLRVRDEWIIHVEVNKMKQAIQQLMDSDHPPRGIIAGNDLTLIEILEFCREENVRIPADLALIGIDEVPFAMAFHPTITTIAQPAFEMGEKAASLLLQKIDKTDMVADQSVYRFEPKLNIRESSYRG